MDTTQVIQTFFSAVENCLLHGRVSDYPYICCGKTRIPGTNDAFEFEYTEVRNVVLIFIIKSNPLFIVQKGSDFG